MNSGAVGIGLTPMIGVAPMPDEQIAQAVPATAAHSTQILETGIKPIDLFCPLTSGGSVGLFGIQGVGRIVLVEELMRRLRESAGLRIFYLVEPNEPDSVRGMLTAEKEYPGDVVGKVEVMWLLTEAATDPDFAATTELFDASIYCSPLIGIQGLYPAIDPLISRSQNLRAEVVGQEHFETATRVRETIARSRELMIDPVLLELLACRARGRARVRAMEFPQTRLATLRAEDQLLVMRARKLERFLTTPFFVAEPFSNRPGRHVSLRETIAGCRDILDGKLDERPEDSLLFIGEIGQAA
jgi:F0F1-type ATP synthase beta subunit